jgi:hypothetical protein
MNGWMYRQTDRQIYKEMVSWTGIRKDRKINRLTTRIYEEAVKQMDRVLEWQIEEYTRGEARQWRNDEKNERKE